ncbi:MAG TPA: branched-chain amino acid ABC transporter permease [Symbiobacteriaceae bacterium]|nr:branched-chain amino acid ABC transporter permease [Symbiobacteriaceae bacterium]
MGEFLQLLPQVTIDGLLLGCVYAVVAIGYTMVYGVLEFINFAHSEIFMVGAFIGAEIFVALGNAGLIAQLPHMVVLLTALLGAMLLSGLIGMGVERLAYRPLRGAPRLVPLIAAIGVSFFLQDLVRIIETAIHGNFVMGVPSLFPGQMIPLPGGLTLSVKALLIVVASVVMMGVLTLFVQRTRVGKAMRAVAQDRATAGLMGINVNQIITMTFFVGAAMGGAAGTLFAVQYTSVDPYIGFVLGMKAFTAAVFGGIGNLPGAMLGGVLLGLFEAYGAAFLGAATGQAFGAEYKDVLAFALLILILIFKPAGLLGKAVGEKV